MVASVFLDNWFYSMEASDTSSDHGVLSRGLSPTRPHFAPTELWSDCSGTCVPQSAHYMVTQQPVSYLKCISIDVHSTVLFPRY